MKPLTFFLASGALKSLYKKTALKFYVRHFPKISATAFTYIPMKTIQVRVAHLTPWTIRLFSIPKADAVYFKYLIIGENCGSQYQSSQLYATEQDAYLAAYFFCLRASLDKEACPALIVDRESGYILSLNLPAFELLAIDAVGCKFLDFAANLETYRAIDQHLQSTEDLNQPISLFDADGWLLDCWAEARTEAYFPKLGIFYLKVNQ